jgi:hypothetical protein
MDQLADRWLISQFCRRSDPRMRCVSTTGDATGSYARYDYNLFSIGGSALYDYPHFGVWPDRLLHAMNVFNSSGTAYSARSLPRFNRTKMLAGI